MLIQAMIYFLNITDHLLQQKLSFPCNLVSENEQTTSLYALELFLSFNALPDKVEALFVLLQSSDLLQFIAYHFVPASIKDKLTSFMLQ